MALHTKLTAPNGVEFEQPLGLFINNEFVLPEDSTPRITVVDPSTGTPIVDVHAASAADVDKAVKAARNAQKEWKETDGSVRAELLDKLCVLIEENLTTLASIEAWDSGKAYSTEGIGNIAVGLKVFKYYAGWADKALSGKTIEVGPNKFAYTLHEPVGVCGQIIPWNYPFLMAAWKLAPALATGNSVILKTAENTPLSMLYMGKLFKEAGYPPGVVNIFTGLGREAGAALAAHLDVDKIAFTGSTAVGQQIMKLASSNLKSVTLECGGKSPMIIFEDANVKSAAKHAYSALMSNQGQTCTAMSRYIVHESVYQEFIQLYKEYVEEHTTIGLPFDKGTTQGPQISEVQQKKVQGYIKKGIEEGADLVLGEGSTKIANKQKDGFYVHPTIFGNVKDDMTIFQEEIFGPVAACAKFRTEQEAIDLANNSHYGLGASVFTRDITRAHKVASKLESGQVWINSGNDSDYRIPFGGYKMSGIGRELGEYGLQIYTKVKAVHVNLSE